MLQHQKFKATVFSHSFIKLIIKYYKLNYKITEENNSNNKIIKLLNKFKIS